MLYLIHDDDDDDVDDDVVAVIRSGDKYMFDELSEDEMETTSSSEALGDRAGPDVVDGAVPVAPDWREEKIGVGPVEVCHSPPTSRRQSRWITQKERIFLLVISHVIHCLKS